MIGNLGDAMLIYRRRKNYRWVRDRKFDAGGHFLGGGPLPKGWKLLGSGTYRAAYLSPDGVVYKVAFTYLPHTYEPNENDLEEWTYRECRREKVRHKGWRLARMTAYRWYDNGLYVTVNAQEYVEGWHEFCDEPVDSPVWGSFTQKMDNAFHAFGLIDAHEGNYVVTKKGRVLIDYAR